jgi:glutamate-1-semialdehyde 2,1-aminomutase/spore coat polysaccharide biosynthesis protein SpsF
MSRSATSTACIVQAHPGSAALPSKVLAPLGGIPVLAHILRRCLAIPGIDRLVCATETGPESDAIVALAKKFTVAIYRGAETDRLSHFRHAVGAVGAKVVLRVTSDCPLIDPAICGAVLRLRAEEEADYAANNMPPSWPHGLDCEAFTTEALEEADLIATDPTDRAQVTPWIRRNRAFRRVNLAGPGGAVTEQRWMLDYPEDLAFLSALYDRIGQAATDPSWDDIAALVDREPQLALINEARKQR